MQNLIMASHILWLHDILETKKINFFTFEIFKLGGWLPQNFSVPFIGEKKNPSDYRVHGIRIDRLKLTVSMQKLVLTKVYNPMLHSMWRACHPHAFTRCIPSCSFRPTLPSAPSSFQTSSHASSLALP